MGKKWKVANKIHWAFLDTKRSFTGFFYKKKTIDGGKVSIIIK